MTRHFLDIEDLSVEELNDLLALAEQPVVPRVLAGLGVAMLFEKPSARTRNSTEMATFALGGHAVYIQGHEVGIDTRETAEDVARTLACFHRVVCARVLSHETLNRMAAALDTAGTNVAVVNLLSDWAHPCQALADLLTLREVLAPDTSGPAALAGRSLAYVGDANNTCRSLAKAAMAAGMDVRVASPSGYGLSEEELSVLAWTAAEDNWPGTLHTTEDPLEAAAGADALYTDAWTSMGQEEEVALRRKAFRGYCVDERLVGAAAPTAVVLHCLPAHRGEEIAATVLDGPHSVVWRQAANRMTAMRGLFAWLLGAGSTGPGLRALPAEGGAGQP
ncbi:MAG: ornithine carbamoyltransferase [Acidimicrobiales bacterium]